MPDSYRPLTNLSIAKNIRIRPAANTAQAAGRNPLASSVDAIRSVRAFRARRIGASCCGQSGGLLAWFKSPNRIDHKPTERAIGQSHPQPAALRVTPCILGTIG